MKKILLVRDFFLSAVALGIGGAALYSLPWTAELAPVQMLHGYLIGVGGIIIVSVGLALPILSVSIYKKGC